MTSMSKNVYIDQVDHIVKKYSNTYHRTIKIESVDVKANKLIDSSKEINNNVLKFKIGDTVRISKQKDVFA